MACTQKDTSIKIMIYPDQNTFMRAMVDRRKDQSFSSVNCRIISCKLDSVNEMRPFL